MIIIIIINNCKIINDSCHIHFIKFTYTNAFSPVPIKYWLTSKMLPWLTGFLWDKHCTEYPSQSVLILANHLMARLHQGASSLPKQNDEIKLHKPSIYFIQIKSSIVLGWAYEPQIAHQNQSISVLFFIIIMLTNIRNDSRVTHKYGK